MHESREHAARIDWSEIEENLNNLRSVEGGFSGAHRGLVVLPSGREVFVKLGTNPATDQWTRREIELYGLLAHHAFPHAPSIVATNGHKTGFALDALTPDQGWDWSPQWTEERLTATLAAMNDLARIKLIESQKDMLGPNTINESKDGWRYLRDSVELFDALLQKLRAAGHGVLAEWLDVDTMAGQSRQFKFRANELVHYDVRADNCPWNEARQAVMLVDWNEAQLGDRRIDVNAFLVHVHHSGLDVRRHVAELLDPNALHWLAGVWFKSAATPIWQGGPEHLRDFQLNAGITALQLAHGS